MEAGEISGKNLERVTSDGCLAPRGASGLKVKVKPLAFH